MTTPAPCRFTVRGVPKPSPRPRARAMQTKQGHHIAQVYAGKTDKDWKGLVAAAAREAWGDRPVEMGPVHLHVEFIFLRPKSVSVKKRPKHTVKPDLDNLIKSVQDALNGLVWRDDAQVVRCRSYKDYAAEMEFPGAVVQVTFL